MNDITYYIKRETDGRIARIIIEDAAEDEDDPWKPLEAMPMSWDLVDESMVLLDGLDYDFDATFYADEDEELSEWLEDVASRCERDLADDEGCAVRIVSDRDDGIATVTWTPRDLRLPRVMRISLDRPETHADIAMGCDPVEEGWEDGAGSIVCWDNADLVPATFHYSCDFGSLAVGNDGCVVLIANSVGDGNFAVRILPHREAFRSSRKEYAFVTSCKGDAITIYDYDGPGAKPLCVLDGRYGIYRHFMSGDMAVVRWERWTNTRRRRP